MIPFFMTLPKRVRDQWTDERLRVTQTFSWEGHPKPTPLHRGGGGAAAACGAAHQ